MAKVDLALETLPLATYGLANREEQVPCSESLSKEYPQLAGKTVSLPLKDEKGKQVGTIEVLLRYETLESVHTLAQDLAQKTLLHDAMKEAVVGDKAKRNGSISLTVEKATNLLAADRGNSSDPYCVIDVMGEGEKLLHSEQTSKVNKTLHPEWKYSTTIETCVQTSALKLTLMDHDLGSADDVIGLCYLPIEFVERFRTETSVMLDVTTEDGKRKGQLYLKLHYQPSDPASFSGAGPKKKLFGCCGSRPAPDGLPHGSGKRPTKARSPSELHAARQQHAEYTDPEHKDPFFNVVHKTVGEMYEIVGSGINKSAAFVLAFPTALSLVHRWILLTFAHCFHLFSLQVSS